MAGSGDVLIRVHAASVFIGDWHVMTGLPYLGRLAFGLRARSCGSAGRTSQVPSRRSGRVSRGSGVGDEVYGTCRGSFADYANARQDMVAPKPANLTFEQAATVPITGTTALQAVRDRGRVKSGQDVLIIGAAGGVGSFAVQIAKAFGAHVTGVCSTAQVDLVRSIGADEVIDYTREDFAELGQRYDVILDIAGNRSVSNLRQALAPKGTLIIVGGEGGGRWFGGINRQLGAQLRSMFVGQRLGTFIAKQNGEDLLALTELIEAGKVTPVIGETFPLPEVPEAIRHLTEGHARGKVVITV